MAAIPISISGVMYDKTGRTQTPIYIIGSASIVGLSVGGGPIIPPEDSEPPHIWGGGNEPFPTPPIANVPGAPGYRPPGDHIWGPTDPRPTPPIANVPGLPPMPDQPPSNPSEPKPPPPGGGWGWHPEYGWGYFPGNGGKPHPIGGGSEEA